jgi:hypothetical protein
LGGIAEQGFGGVVAGLAGIFTGEKFQGAVSADVDGGIGVELVAEPEVGGDVGVGGAAR